MSTFRLPLRRPSRRAFTLLEIALVLAVMVVIAAMSWPAMSTAFETRRLKTAAEQLRADFGAARVEAMSSGLIQAMRCESESGRYTVRRWGGLDASIEAGSLADEETLMLEAVEVEEDADHSRQLPDRVTFVASDALLDSRAFAVEMANSAEQAIDAEGPATILFYPDGTTSTAAVTIKNEHGKYITVELRGLTGVARFGDWFTAEELAQ